MSCGMRVFECRENVCAKLEELDVLKVKGQGTETDPPRVPGKGISYDTCFVFST
jgi:hypothetical protein